MELTFWEYVNGFGGIDSFMDSYLQGDIAPGRSAFLLSLEQPDFQRWTSFHGPDDLINLGIHLVLALANGASDNEPPKKMQYSQYSPGNFKLHFGHDEFQSILFQRSPDDSVSFIYDYCFGDGFGWPAFGERFVTLVRQRRGLFNENGRDYNRDIEGAAICIIRGKKVDVYPFPPNWVEIVEFVHRELKKLTA